MTITIDFIDTDRFRNHDGASHLILDDDAITYEAISKCDWYSDDYAIPPVRRAFYIRTKYKRKKVNGAHFGNVYQSELDRVVYHLEISLEGSTDDIVIKYEDRKVGYEIYKKVTDWIFETP